ncbi:MAG: protein kinase [Acidimicrobiia bacterium]
MTLEPGAVVDGRYEITRQLSAGATSETYLATDRRLGRDVALRTLRPGLATLDVVAKFRQAAGAFGAVRGPEIVTVYDYGVDGDVCYVSTEYVDGHSVAHEIRSGGAFAPERAVQTALEVATALDTVHRAGLIHGGLTPRCVLLPARGGAKVADFGTNGPALGAVQPGTAAEIAMYLSPEQSRGDTPDARSDLYALGVLFYEMLTGASPFAGTDVHEIARRQVAELPPPPSRLAAPLPFGCDVVVMRLLAKHPEDRYHSADEVAGDLLGLRDTIRPPQPSGPTRRTELVDLSGGGDATMAMTMPPGPPPATPAPTTAPPTTGRGWLWAAATIVIVALFVGVIVLALKSGDSGSKPEPTSTTAGAIRVPNVVGKLEVAATDQLRALGFQVTVTSQSNVVVPAGQVFDQSPNAGAKAQKDDVVLLTVSTGAPTTTTASTTTTAPTTTAPITTTAAPTTTATAPATTTAPTTTTTAPTTST